MNDLDVLKTITNVTGLSGYSLLAKHGGTVKDVDNFYSRLNLFESLGYVRGKFANIDVSPRRVYEITERGLVYMTYLEQSSGLSNESSIKNNHEVKSRYPLTQDNHYIGHIDVLHSERSLCDDARLGIDYKLLTMIDLQDPDGYAHDILTNGGRDSFSRALRLAVRNSLTRKECDCVSACSCRYHKVVDIKRVPSISNAYVVISTSIMMPLY